MQAVVVAVDFSNTSIHAIEYAIPLANKLKSNIILVWVDKISPSESLYPDTSTENRNEAKKRFDEIVVSYSRRMGKNLRMEYKLRKGKIYHEVDVVAKNSGAGLIITGAHGISGFEEYWIGSNAYKIVTYAGCPVITVRHDYPIRKEITRIIVPVDSSAETIQKLPYVVRIAKLFRSEVHVLATHSSHLSSIQRLTGKFVQQITSYLYSNGINFIEDSIVSNDLTRDMLSYSTEVKADLIAIMTEQETPASILLGPRAQQLINNSVIPVLSIHPQENFCLK